MTIFSLLKIFAWVALAAITITCIVDTAFSLVHGFAMLLPFYSSEVKNIEAPFTILICSFPAAWLLKAEIPMLSISKSILQNDDNSNSNNNNDNNSNNKSNDNNKLSFSLIIFITKHNVCLHIPFWGLCSTNLKNIMIFV